MERKRWIALVIGILVLVAALPTAYAEPEKITINAMLRGFLTQESPFEKNLERFKADHPNVEVVINIASDDSAFVVAYAADNSPDIWMVGDYSIRGDINNGRLYPINEYLTQEQIDDLYPLYRDRVSKDGNIYAWMANTDARIIYYNKDIFEKAGLDREYKPKTWTEWLDVMEKTNHVMGPDQYAYTFPGSLDINTPLMWDALVHQCGGVTVEDATGKIMLGSDASVRAAEFYKEIIDKKYVPEAIFGMDSTIRKKEFAMGNLAMMMGGSWELAQIRADSEMDVDNVVGWFPIPYPEDGKPATIGGFWNLAISSKTKHPDEAWALISYLYSEDYLKTNVIETNAVPTRISYIALPEVQENAFNKAVSEYAAEAGYPEVSSEYFMEIMDPITAALVDIWQNGADARETLTATADELNATFGF